MKDSRALSAVKLVGHFVVEAAATGLVYLYFILAMSFANAVLITPKGTESCGNASGGTFIALLLLSVIVIVIIERDARLEGSGNLSRAVAWFGCVYGVCGCLNRVDELRRMRWSDTFQYGMRSKPRSSLTPRFTQTPRSCCCRR